MWYCTMDVQDGTLWWNWVKEKRDLSILIFVTLHESSISKIYFPLFLTNLYICHNRIIDWLWYSECFSCYICFPHCSYFCWFSTFPEDLRSENVFSINKLIISFRCRENLNCHSSIPPVSLILHLALFLYAWKNNFEFPFAGFCW